VGRRDDVMPLINDELIPWDIDIRYSHSGMAKVLHAIVECRGQILDSNAMKYEGSPRNTWPLQLRVKLPRGMEGKFREISQAELSRPPRVQGLNLNAGEG
jgi:hypothetical protein